MMDEIKKNELNEQEMDSVTGGIIPMIPLPPLPDLTEEEMQQRKETDEAIFNAVDTTWKVVKHALEEIF